MSNWLDGVDKNMLQEGEELQKKFDEASDGFKEGEIHDVRIRLAYLGIYDSGAKYFVIEFEKENGQRDNIRETITSGDEKKNKTYYEKDGKKLPLPGINKINSILKTVGTNVLEIKPTNTVIEVFGKKEQRPVFKELTGKKLKVGVQKEESENDGIVYVNSKFTPLSIDASDEEIDKVLKKIQRKSYIATKALKKESNSSDKTDSGNKSTPAGWGSN
jgi:hypothetical protein